MNCPFCGAESSESSINLGAIKAWACGTNYAQRRHYYQSKGKTISAACSALFRSEDCYNRQIAWQAEHIADLEKRLADAEKRLEAWRDFWKAVKPWLYLEGVKNPLIPFIHRLKSMGEI